MKKLLKKTAKQFFGGGYNTLVLPKHYMVAVFSNLKRGFPSKDLKVIAVTGTNGKTSTAFLIYSILKEANYDVGLMTTVAYGYKDKIKDQIAHMTTQPVQILQDRIVELKEQGMKWLVLEVTSQALVQFRILGIPIDIAVMTNVTHEHLDYHRTFDKYLQAKLKLFRLANRNHKGRRLGIINVDDDNSLAFIEAIKNVACYSLNEDSDRTIARPSKLSLTPIGSKYTLNIKEDTYQIVCHLAGRFNVANSIAAVLVARALGLNRQQIETGIASLKEVEGRMTAIKQGQDFAVVVDFAHTPDSFKKLFKDLRPLVKGNLIVMFGSAGRRDKIKRSLQGKIAGEYADFLVLTEEDDRDEDGLAILKQIAQGAQQAQKEIDKNIFLVHNRLKAIKKALSLAQSKHDMVLLLGKGHEKTIIRNDGEHAWDEIGATEKILKKMSKP